MRSESSIAVVIPAYRAASYIEAVISKIPPEIDEIIVVDDASPDDLQAVLQKIKDKRLVILRHEKNGGVGAAMKTGYLKALELGADIVVKVDADGQMDPDLIQRFVEPIHSGNVDFTKGNRFADISFIRNMPIIRRIGNVALSFLVKVASGYWHLFDPCNGYTAIRADLLNRMNLARVANRYFFEISMLCEAYLAQATLEDIPMKPVYGDQLSSLRPSLIVTEFSPRLIARTLYRIFMTYFLQDFNMVSLFLISGVPLLIFGIGWSILHWIIAIRTGVTATTGTVMIGALSIILGFQLLLQALVLDVQNEPGRYRRM